MTVAVAPADYRPAHSLNYSRSLQTVMTRGGPVYLYSSAPSPTSTRPAPSRPLALSVVSTCPAGQVAS